MDNMEQLSSLLAPILNDPNAMAGIADAAAQLGLGDILNGVSASPSAPPEQKKEPHDSDRGMISGDLLSAAGKLAPLLGELNKDDDTTRLLCALKPFLHGERARRLEDAERIIRLLRIASSMRSQGII